MRHPSIRRLRGTDRMRIVTHFLSLDVSTLRARFGGVMSPEAVQRYAETVQDGPAIVFGAFPDGRLRAVGELRALPDSWPRACEAAFTVAPDWQNRGLGDALLARVLAVAQNRGYRVLYMICLPENRRMQNLARKHRAVLDMQPGQVAARLTPPWPTPLSITEEMAGEYTALIRAAFRWPV